MEESHKKTQSQSPNHKLNPQIISKVEGSCHCGKVQWTYDSPIESTTACNCTICRRIGALWAYGYEGVALKFSGITQSYMRGKEIEFHFCASCGCSVYYLGKSKNDQGQRKGAINLRGAKEPESIAHLLIDHFDGLDQFDDLPRDGKTVRELWF